MKNKFLLMMIAFTCISLGASCSHKLTNSKVISNPSNEKIAKTGNKSKDYYKISVEKNGDYNLYLFDENKNIIYHETFGREPNVSKLNNNIIQIRLIVGSPATYYTFFDIKKKKKSPEYFNPNLIENGKIVYMDFQKSVLVISDIFDQRKYYKEIHRNFSPAASLSDDVIEAKFIENSKLYLKYYGGNDFAEIKETINLNS